MKCQTTELEIETVVSRIKNGDMDLQPDFQRGEIWTPQKKRKLIDSILRGWRIPPIHVVLNSHAIDEVLDGQQRLAAIRDFNDNIICVDGKIEPFDSSIASLDGMFYRDLPKEWQRRFRQYSINIVRLTEYKPEEPAELFYRLNQPSALTSAEQRNAYIGVTRDQVKNLSNMFISLGGTKELLGFSNSRLAYDEIISKFCYSVELGTLKKKITSTDISEQYRKGQPFSDECIEIVDESIHKFLASICARDDYKFSFNKATLYSWLIFTRQNLDMDETAFSDVITYFEFCRAFVKGQSKKTDEKYLSVYAKMLKQLPFFELMLNTFNQRSSMGSTDALSIIYRDVIIALFRDALLYEKTDLLTLALSSFSDYENMNSMLETIVSKYSWGEAF
ncbi:MAG: DUF262 domain-containing protein [Oscillospiraceae bacterium]|nr:DUF262 domain-containing protein [Oscillospiraceae bacterium]